jgi:hypothetical protein
LQIKTKIVSCHTADSKPVKHEINGTAILPPLVFPAYTADSKPVKQEVNGTVILPPLVFPDIRLARNIEREKYKFCFCISNNEKKSFCNFDPRAGSRQRCLDEKRGDDESGTFFLIIILKTIFDQFIYYGFYRGVRKLTGENLKLVLGQVLNCKLDCFDDVHELIYADARPHQ